MKRSSFLLSFLTLSASVACSSSQNLGSAGLDGTWDITFTASNTYSGGTLTVSGGTAQLTLIHPDEGTVLGGCTVTTHRDVLGVTVSGDGSSAAANSTAERTSTVCASAGSSSYPESSVIATRLSTGGSSYGLFGGTWTMAVTDLTQSSSAAPTVCSVSVLGTAVVASCGAAGSLSASVSADGATLSGSAPGYEFAARRQ